MSIRGLIRRLKDRRRASRIQTQGLSAHYWTGGIPQPRDVRDIGVFGACIVAPDVFYPGTLVQITLENRAVLQDDGKNTHISVVGRVCRKTDDGFCVAFLFGALSERGQLRDFLQGVRTRVESQGEVAPVTQNEPKTDESKGTEAAVNRAPGQNQVTPGQDDPRTVKVHRDRPAERYERETEARRMTKRARFSSG